MTLRPDDRRRALPLAVATIGALAAMWVSGSHPSHAKRDPHAPPPVPPVVAAELLPGGAATSKASTDTTNAFSASSANLSFEKEFDFKIGNAIFRKFWVTAPASTRTSDGLGPLYNARSCQGCHLKDGRGHPPDPRDAESEAVSMLMRLSVPATTDADKAALRAHRINSVPEPVYGGQLQPFAIPGVQREGQVHIRYVDQPVTFSDGKTITLRKPSYRIGDLNYGALQRDTMISPRIAPQMIGLGLLEAVDEADILSRADADDRDGDGISGRPSRVYDLQSKRVALGRFGWKAGTPTLEQQSADALLHDIGISSAMFPKVSGDCTATQTACLAAPSGAPKAAPTSEIGADLLRLITFYSGNLAVPPRRDATRDVVLAGRSRFYEAGCASCHRPSFVTGASATNPHLAKQTIWPYTDMLLHDMGEGLADGRPDGVATGREWRTAPLWGIGLTGTVSGHTMLLHDGRARNVTEAILWHGGEAEAARQAFIALSKEDRDALVAFVNSL